MLEVGFEGRDFILKPIGGNVSGEGRMRAEVWTSVCSRSNRQFVY